MDLVMMSEASFEVLGAGADVGWMSMKYNTHNVGLLLSRLVIDSKRCRQLG